MYVCTSIVSAYIPHRTAAVCDSTGARTYRSDAPPSRPTVLYHSYRVRWKPSPVIFGRPIWHAAPHRKLGISVPPFRNSAWKKVLTVEPIEARFSPPRTLPATRRKIASETWEKLFPPARGCVHTCFGTCFGTWTVVFWYLDRVFRYLDSVFEYLGSTVTSGTDSHSLHRSRRWGFGFWISACSIAHFLSCPTHPILSTIAWVSIQHAQCGRSGQPRHPGLHHCCHCHHMGCDGFLGPGVSAFEHQEILRRR
jgi:hypothetical protein